MARRASVSIRFTGPGLEPAQVTRLLGTDPTLAYRKGETFRAGRTQTERRGRTGLWLLELAERFPDRDLIGQSQECLKLLTDDDRFGRDMRRGEKIRRLVESDRLELDVTLYWHGELGEPEPAADACLGETVSRLGGTLHIDFDRDTDADRALAERAIA